VQKERSSTARLTIGHDIDFPPFAQVEDGRSAGALVEVCGAAFAGMGFATVFLPLGLGEFEATLEGGAIDAFVGVAATAARRERFALSAPLATTGGAWFRPRAASGRVRRAATPGGGPLVAALKAMFPDIVVIETPDYRDALRRAAEGEADAAALNLHAGARVAQREFPGHFPTPEAPFLPLDLTIATRCGDPARLLPRIDAEIAILRAKGVIEAALRPGP
jgi:ABC-type amino acid transport substrate-binding protein